MRKNVKDLIIAILFLFSKFTFYLTNHVQNTCTWYNYLSFTYYWCCNRVLQRIIFVERITFLQSVGYQTHTYPRVAGPSWTMKIVFLNLRNNSTGSRSQISLSDPVERRKTITWAMWKYVYKVYEHIYIIFVYPMPFCLFILLLPFVCLSIVLCVCVCFLIFLKVLNTFQRDFN